MIRFIEEAGDGHLGWVGRRAVAREGEVLGGGEDSSSSQLLKVVEEEDMAYDGSLGKEYGFLYFDGGGQSARGSLSGKGSEK